LLGKKQKNWLKNNRPQGEIDLLRQNPPKPGIFFKASAVKRGFALTYFKETLMKKKSASLVLSGLFALGILLTASCSKTISNDHKRYDLKNTTSSAKYTQNNNKSQFGYFSVHESSDFKYPEIIPTKKKDNDRYLEISKSQSLKRQNQRIYVASMDQGGWNSGNRLNGYLSQPFDEKHISDQPMMEQQTISTMIEGKVMENIKAAFYQRDQEKFNWLYDFFIKSFPDSRNMSELDGLKKEFYYGEFLDKGHFNQSLVEITYSKFDTQNELTVYFKTLKNSGFDAVKVEVVQLSGQKIYQFQDEKGNSPLEGYYFKTKKGPVVSDNLARIARTAKDNGLKIYVSMPLRNFPALDEQEEIIMDESWDPFLQTTAPNGKLDLLNPKSKDFILSLIGSLLDYDIDGIIFKDDFTYDLVEGFSSAAQKRFKEDTGFETDFADLFVGVSLPKINDFDMLGSRKFDDVALWRTREIRHLLWELFESTRKLKKGIKIGIEATPEMLGKEATSVRWYSTGLRFISGLDSDLFLIKLNKEGQLSETDQTTLEGVLDHFQEARKTKHNETIKIGLRPRDHQIYLKVTLNQETKNIFLLNRKIKALKKLAVDRKDILMAIGPVSRINDLDFVPFIKKEY